MQDEKTEVRNRILYKMADYMTIDQRARLNDAIVSALRDMDVTRANNELATVDDTNEHILEMFRTIKGPHLSKESLRMYMYTARRFVDIIHKSILTVGPLDVELFIQAMSKTNSRTSCNNHLRNLSALFRWLVIQRIITFNPCDQVEPLKEIKKPIERLTFEEFDRMKNGCKSLRDRCLIEFLRCTALRTEELGGLTVGSIDFQNGSILAYIPKQRKYRMVYLDRLTLGYIREYTAGHDSTEPLFRGKCGKPMHHDTYNAILKRIAARAGVKKRLYVHLMRRTCATHIIERGGSIEEAGIYLGHKPASVTGQHYTDYGETYIKRIFDKYVAAA